VEAEARARRLAEVEAEERARRLAEVEAEEQARRQAEKVVAQARPETLRRRGILLACLLCTPFVLGAIVVSWRLVSSAGSTSEPQTRTSTEATVASGVSTPPTVALTVSTSASPPPTVGATVSTTASTLSDVVEFPNVYDQPEEEGLAQLWQAGVVPVSYPVCSGSVAGGRIRQVILQDQTILVDSEGVTSDGEEVPRGTQVEVKVSNGTSCSTG
jgi:hypothetical protein